MKIEDKISDTYEVLKRPQPPSNAYITHTHTDYAIIDSDNELATVRRQATISINVGMLLITPVWTTLSEIGLPKSLHCCHMSVKVSRFTRLFAHIFFQTNSKEIFKVLH